MNVPRPPSRLVPPSTTAVTLVSVKLPWEGSRCRTAHQHEGAEEREERRADVGENDRARDGDPRRRADSSSDPTARRRQPHGRQRNPNPRMREARPRVHAEGSRGPLRADV